MLFRSEVVDYIAVNGAQGQVLLRSPWLFWVCSLCACVFSAALLGLLFFAQHTQTLKVNGQLAWDKALSPVYSPYRGQIKQLAQKESSQLKQGQLLLTIATADGEQPIRVSEAANLAMLLVKPGQQIEAGQLLAQLIPADARLQAEFRVPAQALPYIHEGTKLGLRIDAFPYQKFGMFEGEISQIAGVASGEAQTEKKYRVVVQLPQQATRYFGKTVAFQADMLVDTDIALYQHSLLASMFEPLLAVKGTL